MVALNLRCDFDGPVMSLRKEAGSRCAGDVPEVAVTLSDDDYRKLHPSSAVDGDSGRIFPCQ